jgi:hypothetical protein
MVPLSQMKDYELQERLHGRDSMHRLCEEVTASRDGREVILVFFWVNTTTPREGYWKDLARAVR